MKNLKGAKMLSKQELQTVKGAGPCPVPQTQAQCQAIGGYWLPNNMCLHWVNYCL
ncbi:hypothetical protein [uncultured Psychroserpens sp.]|uniref:hypothetical protein n=1 Tax=uncultured Psychroserpens sp. TaxID=255436 RepID=UPI00260BD33D|nr:hypothetical protein [uncultured Psychroserpens sp.]